MAKSPAPSGNFRNPLGLLGRMLMSGDRAAYAALYHEALRIAARPIDWILAEREKKKINAADPHPLPLILVVAAQSEDDNLTI